MAPTILIQPQLQGSMETANRSSDSIGEGEYCQIGVHNHIIKRILLIALFLQVIAEFNAGLLFRWPLEHSCARPPAKEFATAAAVGQPNRSSPYYHLDESEVEFEFKNEQNETVNKDDFQTYLINAASDDALTRARALAQNINFDDIGRCYEYPASYIEYPSNRANINSTHAPNTTVATINWEGSLEACAHGYHFDRDGPDGIIRMSLSVVDYFKLVCARQWLKELLTLAQVVGLALGFGLARLFWSLWMPSSLAAQRRGQSARRTLLLMGTQLFTLLLAWLLTPSPSEVCQRTNMDMHNSATGGSRPSYGQLLGCILLRSVLAGSLLARLLLKWQLVVAAPVAFASGARSDSEWSTWWPSMRPLSANSIVASIRRQLRENHLYLVVFVLLVAGAKALFAPLALRLFTDWCSLNGALTSGALATLLFVIMSELYCSSQLRHFARRSIIASVRRRLTRWPHKTTVNQTVTIHESDDGEEEGQGEGEGHSYGGENGYNARAVFSIEAEPPPPRTSSKRQVRKRRAPTAGLCEFCSLRQPTVGYVAMNHHQIAQSPTSGLGESISVAESNSNGGGNESSSAVGPSGSKETEGEGVPVYQPTTRPVGALCTVVGGGNGRREDATISGAWANSAWANKTTPHHRAAGDNLTWNAHLNLGKWPTLTRRVCALTFCLAFNYFLLDMMPNHNLLHPESIDSLMELKLRSRATIAPKPTTAAANNTNDNRFATPELPVNAASIADAINRNGSHVHPEAANSNVTVQSSGNATMRDTKRLVAEFTKRLQSLVQADGIAGNINEAALINEIHQLANELPMSVSSNESLVRSSTQAPLLQNNNHSEVAMSAASASLGAAHKNTKTATTMTPSSNITTTTTTRASQSQATATPTAAANASVQRQRYQPFDYTGAAFNGRSVATLRLSFNPITVLWRTSLLNGWPIELFVVCLFGTRLTSNFQLAYFKLTRIFSLTKFGAKFLILQWLILAITRRQNHLLELHWLLSLSQALARLVATIMLYSHLHSILKLSRKLNSSALLRAAPIFPWLTLALGLATMAPLMERWDLVVLPMVLILNNSLAYFLAKNLGTSLEESLCPMIFNEQTDVDEDEDEDNDDCDNGLDETEHDKFDNNETNPAHN